MQTLESLQRRMDNVGDLLSIVKTMKTLAAVSIRQYERAVESLADYNRTVDLGLQVVLRHSPEELFPRTRGDVGPLGVLIFGSDQGMCGQFNEQIIDHALQYLNAEGIAVSRRRVLALGARAAAGLESRDLAPTLAWPVPGSIDGITPLIQDVVMQLDTWRSQEQVTRVHLFYNRPLSNAAYRPHGMALLPVQLARFGRLKQQPWPGRTLPTFSMDAGRLLSSLLRQYLFVSLYRAFAESLMAENAARLATMQAAQRNIEERLEELNTLFHQQRQSAITAELLDIVAGFEALTTAG